jgi:predicted MPP superfamily phosphohydrolase
MPWSLRMTLYTFLLVIFPYCYFGWRFSKTLLYLMPATARLVRWLIPVTLILLNLLPLLILVAYYSGQINSFFLFKPYLTIWDYLVSLPFWLSMITLVEILPYLLTLDILQCSANLIFKGLKENLVRVAEILRVLLVAGMVIYVIYRSHVDTHSVQINNFDIHLEKKLPGPGQLNLMLVGDVQVDRYTQDEKLNSFLNHINESKPDLLFFAGDLVTSGKMFIGQGVQALCAANATSDRIACVGDHDLWSDAPAIGEGLTRCGWKFIENNHYQLEHRGIKITVTVLTHVYSQRINRDLLSALLKSRPPADLSILLVHQPAGEIIQAAAENGYDLFLAGHTHGGQVVFKPFGFKLTPPQFENAHYSGYKKVGALNVFVTNGIGLTMMPLRYHAPAEVLEIRIK